MKKKLTDLCDIQYGYAFDSKLFTNDEGYIPLIRIRDVQRGFSETYYSGKYPVEYVVHPGDLLVGMDGEFNISRWKDRDALLNQRVCKITAKNGTSEEYIRFALSKALKEIEQRTSFVTVKHLSAKELNRLVLDIPCYSSQVHIVGLCSSLERIIEKRKKQLQILDELIKARFVEMFGDPADISRKDKVELSEICEKITDGEHGSVARVPNGHPFLNAKQILKNGRIDWDTITYVGDEDHQRIYKRCNPVEGDILLTTTGTIGNVAIMPKAEEVSMDRGITLIKIDRQKVTSEFVAELLKQPSIQTEMGVNVHASAIGHLFMNRVKKLPAILPSMESQAEFTAFVRQVDKSKSVVKKSLDETQLLFDSLMQKYFG